MISSFQKIFTKQETTISLFDSSFSLVDFCKLDLSVTNKELENIAIVNPDICQNYIDGVLNRTNTKITYGGYLEKRNLYNEKPSFSIVDNIRNIHLGIDFWTKAGTKVIAPIKGKIHSFQNNKSKGDYGPTIILQHEIEGFEFHTLYGHLSLASIEKNESLSYKVKLKIDWLDTCTYTLTPVANMTDPNQKNIPKKVLTCQIVEVNSDHYIQVSSTDGNKTLKTSQIEIVE